jgi:hypothetical protein
MYSPAPYAMATGVAELPYLAAQALVMVCITYWLVRGWVGRRASGPAPRKRAAGAGRGGPQQQSCCHCFLCWRIHIAMWPSCGCCGGWPITCCCCCCCFCIGRVRCCGLEVLYLPAPLLPVTGKRVCPSHTAPPRPLRFTLPLSLPASVPPCPRTFVSSSQLNVSIASCQLHPSSAHTIGRPSMQTMYTFFGQFLVFLTPNILLASLLCASFNQVWLPSHGMCVTRYLSLHGVAPTTARCTAHACTLFVL